MDASLKATKRNSVGSCMKSHVQSLASAPTNQKQSATNKNDMTTSSHSFSNNQTDGWTMKEFWFPPQTLCHSTHTQSQNLLAVSPKEKVILPTSLYPSCDRQVENRLIRDLKAAAWEQGSCELSTQERTGQTDRRKITLRLRMRCANHTKKRGSCTFGFTVFWHVPQQHWYYCPPPASKLRHGPNCVPFCGTRNSMGSNTVTLAPIPIQVQPQHRLDHNHASDTMLFPKIQAQPTWTISNNPSTTKSPPGYVPSATTPAFITSKQPSKPSRKRSSPSQSEGTCLDEKKRIPCPTENDRITLHFAVAANAATNQKPPAPHEATVSLSNSSSSSSSCNTAQTDYAQSLDSSNLAVLLQEKTSPCSFSLEPTKIPALMMNPQRMVEDSVSLPSVTMQEAAEAVLSTLGTADLSENNLDSSSLSLSSCSSLSPSSSWTNLLAEPPATAMDDQCDPFFFSPPETATCGERETTALQPDLPWDWDFSYSAPSA